MLQREKADQAQDLLGETGLDCWLTFVRETVIHPDPGHQAVVDADVVRNSAFLFGIGGERIAIVAHFDTAAIRAKGVFAEVIGYDEDIRGPLLAVLKRLAPQRIGLNYSTDDITADGLSHGHWLLLTELLRGTPFVERLTSAAPLLAKLRGRKSPAEVTRIRHAIAITENCVAALTPQLRLGLSERDIADLLHQEFSKRGVDTSWARESCPIVNVGPASDLGHCGPSTSIRIENGHLIHVDLGVRWEGYCSDLQRMWYVRRPDEIGPPDEVKRAFEVAVNALQAGAQALRPGVHGHEVDSAARRVIVDAGYPEFKHALGHGLGRAVHDGGTMLGPRWPCYGGTTDRVVEAGNVFTLELGVPTESGIIGVEEDVLVTSEGCEFLSSFPRELTLI
jgi:Xaa-Pro aminopeptidase